MKNVSVLTPFLKNDQWIKKNTEILKDHPRVLEFVFEEGTSPVGKARQNLLMKARGKYLLWIDSDIELLKNPLDDLLQYLESDEKIAGACSSTIELDNTYYLNEKVRRLSADIYPKKKSHFNCGLFKKSALLKAGGFDPELAAGEDNDIRLRLIKEGFKVIGLKKSLVTHHSSRDEKKEKAYFNAYKQLFNKYGFFENESDCVDLNTLKAKLIGFNIDKKIFFREIYASLRKKTESLLSLPTQIFKNFLLIVNPELVKPSDCGLLITENCIFRCKSCTYWKENKRDLSFKEICSLIDKIKKFGIKNIILVGGEPLIRKDFEQIVDYVKAKKIGVGLITNGYLGKENMPALLKLDSIAVSIDGMRDTHNNLRGLDCWDKAVDLVYELKFKYKKNVAVSTVIQKDNESDFPILSAFLKNFGIIQYILCYSSGGMGQPEKASDYSSHIKKISKNPQDYHLRYEQSQYINLINDKFDGKIKKQDCLSLYKKLMIDAQGNVFSCSAWSKPIGNLFKEQNLKNIWIGSRPLRDSIRSQNVDRCVRCRSCEIISNYVYGKGFFAQLNKRIKKILFGIR